MNLFDEIRKKEKESQGTSQSSSQSSGKSATGVNLFSEIRQTKSNTVREAYAPTRQDVFNSAFETAPTSRMNVQTANKNLSNKLEQSKKVESVQPVQTKSIKEQRKEYVDQKLEQDKRGASSSKVMTAINNVLSPISKGVYTAESFLAPLQKGAGEALGVKAQVAPYSDTFGNKALEVAGNIGGSLTNPTNLSQGVASLGLKTGNAAANAIGNKAPMLNNNLTRRAIEGGTAGAAQGALISAARGETDLDQLGLNTLIGAGLGSAGDVAIGGISTGIKTIMQRMKRNNMPEEVVQSVQEVLALPAPRVRGNSNTAKPDELIVMQNSEMPSNYVDEMVEPLGLPAPKLSKPTTARIEKSINPYREKFENLIRIANDHQFTPGREMEELESLWTQIADYEDVNLDELINLAYPNKTSKINPNLVNQARQNQYNREVAGVPMPVKSMSERSQPQGVLGEVEITSRLGRNPEIDPAVSETLKQLSDDSDYVDFYPVNGNKKQENIETIQNNSYESNSSNYNQPPNEKNRGFIETLNNSENASTKLKSNLSHSNNRTYTPITNEQTVANANKRIAGGLDQAEADLLNKKNYEAEDIATGMRLIQELQTSGNIQRAVTVAERLADELTKAGQTVQAASIWNRLSPEGALMAAQRRVSRINENLYKGQTPVKISKQQANAITESAQILETAGISQERAGEVTQIMARVKAGEEITPDEKQIISEFVQDAKRFLKTDNTSLPKQPKQAPKPKEMNDTKVRDRVVDFMNEQEQAALDRIKARRGNLNSLPLDEWVDYAIVGASKLTKGTVKFADWSAEMVKDFGEGIRPYLNDIYEKSRLRQIQDVKKINDQVISKAEKITESYVKRNADKLRPEDIEFVNNLARKVSSLSDQERRIASQDLQYVLNGFEKVGVGRKLQATQYISMLLNPLTQVRNVVGNEMMYRLERLQRIAATPVDIAYSKLTGKDRTITFKRGPNVWENFFQPTKDYFGNLGEGMRAGWRGVSPEGLTSKYEIQGQAFRSKYNPMTYLEKSLGAVLQGFDYAAYQRAVNQRLSEVAYLDAINRGIKGDDAIKNHINLVMTNLDEATHNMARDYGKFVTLQNDSTLGRKIMGFRRGLNKITTGSDDFGAGSIAVPFAKTPANLLLRGIDYSPAGFLKSIGQAYEVMRNPNTDLTRADVIESASRALFGTGISGLALWLTDKGVLFGKSDKDAEVRKLMQQAGIKDFQVNGSAMKRMIEATLNGGNVDEAARIKPGDTLWGYEWAQPVSMPVAIGSTVYQGIQDSKSPGKVAIDSSTAAVNTLLDSSVMSGIREMFNVPTGSESPFTDIMMNLLKQVPSQFVPSIARQINTLADNTVKETYAPKSDTLGQFTNQAKSNIPGLSQTMPQRVNTLGEPQTKLNTFVDVFLSPAQRSVYNPTPEAQLVIDLINDTGDNSVAPRAVQKYISGNDVKTGEKKKVDLTPEQYVELQTIVGQATSEGLKKVNPNWSSEKKISFIVKVLDDAGKKGRNKIKKDLGLKVTK